MMKTKSASFVDQIRAAVDADGRSRYRICIESGIGQPNMSRFMHGREFFSLEKLNKLAEVLGLHVAKEAPQSAKGGK